MYNAITLVPQGEHGRTRHCCPPGISQPSGEATLAAVTRCPHPIRASLGRGSARRGRWAARTSGGGQPAQAPRPAGGSPRSWPARSKAKEGVPSPVPPHMARPHTVFPHQRQPCVAGPRLPLPTMGGAGRGSTAPRPSTVRPATAPSTYTDKPNRPAGPFSRSRTTKPCSRKTRSALAAEPGSTWSSSATRRARGAGHEPALLGDGVKGDLFQGHPRQWAQAPSKGSGFRGQ